MRGVVRCDHCGAPHRREAASTRFRCDWCGGDNRVEAVRLVEELVLAADDRTRDPATRIREALGSRGLRGATLLPQPPRWTGIWQVVNEAGEEFVTPVATTTGSGPVLRALPAGSLQPVEDAPPTWAGGLPERPAPGADADTMVDAARATFENAEAAVVLVRLVWIGVAEFVVGYGGRSFGALQVLGTDRVIFDSLPDPGASGLVVPERLAAFGTFLVGAIVIGAVIREPAPRLVLELGWLAAGALYWMIRRDRDLGGAR